jgi:hypothetical protein
MVYLFILIGIIAWPDRKLEVPPDKATTKSEPSNQDEDSQEDRTTKAEFDKFITSNAKLNERAMISRTWVPHGRLVEIFVREPQIFATMTEDQFAGMSRFIALSYGKLMGKYIAKRMGERKENESKVDFWYFNISDKSLPTFPYHLAASRYTYVKRDERKGDIGGEKLKPPAKCIEEYIQDKAVKKAVVAAKERFRYKLLNEYRLYGSPMFLKVKLGRKETKSFLGGRQIEKVEEENVPTFIELLAFHSNNFSNLPRIRKEEIFKSLAHDHDEAFGSYVRYYLNKEMLPFEKNFMEVQRVIFSIYLLNYQKEGVKNDVEFLRDLSKAIDLDESSLGDIITRKVWRSLGYMASYFVTKDGSTPVKIEDFDRR